MKTSKIVLMGLLLAVLGTGCEYYTSKPGDGAKVLPVARGTEGEVTPEARPEEEGDGGDEGRQRPTEIAERATPETDRAESDEPRIGPEAPRRPEDQEATPVNPPVAGDVLNGRLPEGFDRVPVPLTPPSAGDVLNGRLPEDIRAGAVEAMIPAGSSDGGPLPGDLRPGDLGANLPTDLAPGSLVPHDRAHGVPQAGAVSEMSATAETSPFGSLGVVIDPSVLSGAGSPASKIVHVFTRSKDRPVPGQLEGRYLLHWQGEIGSDGTWKNVKHHRILPVGHSPNFPALNTFDEAPSAVLNDRGVHVFSRKRNDLIYWQCDPSRFGDGPNDYSCVPRKINYTQGTLNSEIRGCVVSTKDEYGRLHVFAKGQIGNRDPALLHWSGFGGDDLTLQGQASFTGFEPESCPGVVYSPAQKKIYVFSRGKRPSDQLFGGGTLNVYQADIDETGAVSHGDHTWSEKSFYGTYTVPGGENACGAELGYDSEGRMSPIYNPATGKIHLLHTEYAGRNTVIEWTGFENGPVVQRPLTETGANYHVKQYPVGFVDSRGTLRAFAKSGHWNILGGETYELFSLNARTGGQNLLTDHPKFPRGDAWAVTDEVVLRDAPGAIEDNGGNVLIFFRGVNDRMDLASMRLATDVNGREIYKTNSWETLSQNTPTDGCPAIVAP